MTSDLAPTQTHPAPLHQTADVIEQALPALRRYGRALTGSQPAGDALVERLLEDLIAKRVELDLGADPLVAIFQALNGTWRRSGVSVQNGETGLIAQAQRNLSGLATGTREALLLSALEGFQPGQIGEILSRPTQDVLGLIETGRRSVAEATRGRVLIIEDEAVIALDLESIMTGLGHEVVGIAKTKGQAVRLGASHRPDLILADIRLADGSSGIDAVADIQNSLPGIPSIFISAYPERLLSGRDGEPAFLIPKPFTPDQVAFAASQAMFFASVDPLLH